MAEDPRERLLFSRVEAMRRSTREFDAEAMEKRLTDFSTLPGYEELRQQRAIGEIIGLENSYFCIHGGLAGAHTEIDGRTLLNFSCYYLGLNGHPEIVAAAEDAIYRYGISCSASRHVAGERPVHQALERRLPIIIPAKKRWCS